MQVQFTNKEHFSCESNFFENWFTINVVFLIFNTFTSGIQNLIPYLDGPVEIVVFIKSVFIDVDCGSKAKVVSGPGYR